MSSARDSGGLIRNSETVRPHTDLLTELPEPPETFVRQDMPGSCDHRDVLQQLCHTGVIKQVEREKVTYDGDVSPSFRWRYRVAEWAYHAAKEHAANRDGVMPCGHSGIRNLGDGEYTCCYDGCDQMFSRSEVNV